MYNLNTLVHESSFGISIDQYKSDTKDIFAGIIIIVMIAMFIYIYFTQITMNSTMVIPRTMQWSLDTISWGGGW